MGAIDEGAWDIYREIHKAARLVLSRAVTAAGSADAASDGEIDDVRAAVDEVSFVLRGHHHHERDFVDELVARHAPALSAQVDAGHHATESALDDVEALAGRVVDEPALSAAMSREELVQLTEELRGSVPPPEMCRFMQSMLPAMNFAERTDMLGGMSQAPPEIWDQFRGAAEQALTPDEYAAVTQRIGSSA